MSAPRVSVLMSVYNGATYVSAAIESVLGQSFTDFELIIINDASVDSTSEILAEYAQCDRRIVLIQNDRNLGTYPSLNRGLSIARGEYVANLDADDIALPHRLVTQVAFLDEHEAHVLVGSSFILIDDAGRVLGLHQILEDDALIRWSLLFHNCFGHSSVMIRRSVMIMHGLKYSHITRMASDYDLWTRLAQYGLMENLPEPLIKYRMHSGQATHREGDLQLAQALEISVRNLRRLGVELTPQQVMLVQRLLAQTATLTHRDVLEAYCVLLSASRAVSEQDHVNREGLTSLKHFHATEALSFLSLRRIWRNEYRALLLQCLRTDLRSTLKGLIRLFVLRSATVLCHDPTRA